MPEVVYSPSLSVFHQAVVTVIPDVSSDKASIRFQMSVDGSDAGEDIISSVFSSGIIKPFRVFPDPYKLGQVFQISILGSGTISQCDIVSVPMTIYTTTREVCEIQMGYEGNVTLQFYFDGVKVGDDRLFTGTSTYKTEKFYLPAGSRGHVFQYKQINNADGSDRGYISYMSTDAIAPDTEEPKVEQA